MFPILLLLHHLQTIFQQLQAVIYPVLYNKTTSIPIVKFLAKFFSTPIVKYEKIEDSRKMFNPITPSLFFSLENSGTHKNSHIKYNKKTINYHKVLGMGHGKVGVAKLHQLIVYSNLLYKMRYYFLDTQYSIYLWPTIIIFQFLQGEQCEN